MQIEEINGSKGIVNIGGTRREVGLQLLDTTCVPVGVEAGLQPAAKGRQRLVGERQ